MSEEKEFKVIDRRGSRDEEEKKETSGEGFVMKEGPETAQAPHQIDFATFIFSLATGAFINMGLSPDPHTGKTAKNLELARQNIDLLAILKEKTRGNLSEEEKTLLESLLTEVRLRFVDVSKK